MGRSRAERDRDDRHLVPVRSTQRRSAANDSGRGAAGGRLPWTVWSLQQVLLETLDLARIRAVDPDALDEVGHYLPALYFAFNTGPYRFDRFHDDQVGRRKRK